jgi:hypothetical protein
VYPILELPNINIIDLKEEIDYAIIFVNAIIFVIFDIPLSTIDRSFREKAIKEIGEVTCIIEQIDLTDISKTFHPTATIITWNVLQ